jgi:hypothetical protein
MMTKQALLSLLVVTACSKATPSNVGNPDADRASEIKRGEQLVAMGGCGDCHTPKKFDPQLHAPVPDMTRMLSGHPAGAPDPEGNPGATDSGVIGPTFTSFKLPFGVVYARNLTPDKATGLGGWTEQQFVQTLRTGHHQGSGRVLLPPMPWQNLSNAVDMDLHDIWVYLQSIPAVSNQVPDPKVPAEAMAAIDQANQAAAKRAL